MFGSGLVVNVKSWSLVVVLFIELQANVEFEKVERETVY